MATAGWETNACQKALSVLLHVTPLKQLCVLQVTWCAIMGMTRTGAGVVITACLQGTPAPLSAILWNLLPAPPLRLCVTWAIMATAGMVITACQKVLSAPLHAMTLPLQCVVPRMSDVTTASLVAAGWEMAVCPKAQCAPLPVTPLAPPCVPALTLCVTWGMMTMVAGWEITACLLDLSAQLIENNCSIKTMMEK